MRRISFFLILLIMFSYIVSCTYDGIDITSDISREISYTSEENISETADSENDDLSYTSVETVISSDTVSDVSDGNETSVVVSYEPSEASTDTVTEYMIHYSANGGSNAPQTQTKAYDNPITLSDLIPFKDGHNFLYWNTQPDGSGARFLPSEVYNKNCELTLYAIWEQQHANAFPIEQIYNLASKIRYTSDTTSYRNDMFGDFADKEGKQPLYKLTDSVVSGSAESDHVGGYSVSELNLFFDMNGEVFIHEFSIDLYGGKWGIGSPKQSKVTYFVSSDGKDYNEVAVVSPSLGNAHIKSDNGWYSCDFLYTSKEPIKASFVKIYIQISGEHIWASEVKINGYKSSDLLTSLNSIPRIFIKTLDNDRVHRSSYHQCTISVFDPSGKFETITDTNGQIKIRGNSTSGGAKQPYNIKFESKQDVLGFGMCKKWYLIANMYDKTQLRNKLAFDFASSLGMDYVQHTAFVEVYLNGIYIGMYMLCESIGVGESRVDIDEAGNECLLEYEPWEQYSNPEWIRTPVFNILLGFNAPESPTAEQREYYNDILYKAETAIKSKNFEEIAKFVDIDSFVNAFIVHEFFKEVDYATSSTRFYIKDGKLYQGPVWDFDLSSGNCSSAYYTTYNNVTTSGNSWEGTWCYGIFNQHLFKCNEFKEAVIKRYKEVQPIIVNIYNDNSLGKNRMDVLLEEYRDDIDKNYEVWSTSAVYSEFERVPTDGTYDSEIAYLRNWFDKRNQWLMNYFGIK